MHHPLLNRPPVSLRRRFALLAFYLILIASLLLLLAGVLVARNQAQRGIWSPHEPLPPPSAARSPLGTTVELTQYGSDEALGAALDEAQAMGLTWLRQELRWDLAEPARGQVEWEPYDRVIQAASARGFRLVLFLNRTPAWARREGEEQNPFAPPGERDEFARFARAAATRYGAEVYGWQLWDEPNLMPHWGTRIILNPDEYGEFLAQIVPAIRAGDPDAVVATAGLGPTAETSGYNMSEITFLRWLYDTGADRYFDAVALKPYGFWREVAERVYGEERLGLDRVVLVRELMEQRGDATTPIWFVEGGWALLPPEWQGEPPPWGYDAPATQQRRLYETVRRATLEWPWVQLIALQEFQPDAPLTDPHWALALLDPTGQRTPLGERMATIGNYFFNGPLGEGETARFERTVRPTLRHLDYAFWALGALLLGLTARLAWHIWLLPWGAWGDWFRRRPEAVQVATIAALALAFYAADNLTLALLLYAVLGIFIAWRFDLGLAAVAFAIPFYLQSKALASLHFSMVELLLLLCAFVFVVRRATGDDRRPTTDNGQRRLHSLLSTLHSLLSALRPRDGLEWAMLLFALWAGLSVLLAQRFGVAAREFRVVVAESVLWFWLLRRAGLSQAGRWRVLDALVVASTLVALWGLYQWLFTADIIQAEGVRRVRSVYGSPNNLALLLERVLPLCGAVLLLAPRGARRVGYALAAVPLSLALFLTFSRGAWLLGLPAALGWIGWWGGPRARRWVGAAALVGLLALLPFLATERIASVVQLEDGTWFIRFRLWQATLNMLRDFPLVGVGLDNFLYSYDSYRLPEAWREPALSHPHQILLHFWVALGLPGVCFLFWQQAAFWRAWWRAQRRTQSGTLARALLVGLGASMASTLAHGMIDNSYFLVDLAFVWMLTFALVADFQEAEDGFLPFP